jgi:hypothetical protein
MDPDDFVRNSSLWWANDDRDGCAGRDVRKIGAGKVDARRLASGRGASYRHTYCYKGVLGTRNVERRFSTADLTSPAETGKAPRHANGRWGFFLNLDDHWHRGIPPLAGSGQGYPNAPTMVVELEPRRYVVYWFFFGRNHVRVLGVDDVHEGDWERIAVRLDDRNRATHVAYWQHYCQPAARHGSLLTWAQMAQRGQLTGSAHPHAFLARGAHASYPDAGGRDGRTWLPCMNITKGAADHHEGGSVIWETWQRGSDGFAEVTEKPWYGFGGGWGSKTAQGDNAFWGPLGPGPAKPPVPAGWR